MYCSLIRIHRVYAVHNSRNAHKISSNDLQWPRTGDPKWAEISKTCGMRHLSRNIRSWDFSWFTTMFSELTTWKLWFWRKPSANITGFSKLFQYFSSICFGIFRFCLGNKVEQLVCDRLENVKVFFAFLLLYVTLPLYRFPNTLDIHSCFMNCSFFSLSC